jgi:hypothetical protein
MYLCAFATCYESQQSSDGIVLDYRCESFIIILSPALCEPLRTETGLVIAIILDSEDPMGLDNFDVGGSRY